MLRRLQDMCHAHSKALHHAHHGLHASYLGVYVWDWHVPVSPIALALLVLAVASWVLKVEVE